MLSNLVRGLNRYDTTLRQNGVLAYVNGQGSLRQVGASIVPAVSHTTLYHWIKRAAENKPIVEASIAAQIQHIAPSVDIAYDILPDVLDIPDTIIPADYAHDIIQMINWAGAYIRHINKLCDKLITDYIKKPFVYINLIMDTIRCVGFV
jgi:hypothetical protein